MDNNIYGSMANPTYHISSLILFFFWPSDCRPKITFYEICNFFSSNKKIQSEIKTGKETLRHTHTNTTKSSQRFISILSLWVLRPTTVKHLNDIAHFIHVRRLLVSKSFSCHLLPLLLLHQLYLRCVTVAAKGKITANNFVFDRLATNSKWLRASGCYMAHETAIDRQQCCNNRIHTNKTDACCILKSVILKGEKTANEEEDLSLNGFVRLICGCISLKVVSR